ncbi:MAG: hypothetical protein R2726_09430 [Acidimicrobiales bacterium]
MSDDDARRFDRRRFLAAGAAAGAAGWVAPVVLSTPAFAATTSKCTSQGTISWSSFALNQPGTSLASYPWDVATIGNVKLTFSFLPGVASPPLSFTGSTQTGVVSAAQGGFPTGQFFQFGKNTAAQNNAITLRMQFDTPIANLQFVLVDIDRAVGGGNNFVDQVTLAPTLGGTPVTGTFTPQQPPATQLAPNTPTTNTTAVYSGTSTGGVSDSTGNLLVSVPGPLDRLDLTYTSTQTGTGTTQIIGVRDMFWTCPSVSCPDSTSPIQLVTTCQNDNGANGCADRYTNFVYLRRESSTQTVQIHGNAAGTLLPYFDDVAVITVTPPTGSSVTWNVRSPAGTNCNEPTASNTLVLNNTRSGTCPNVTTTAGGADITSMFGSQCGVFTVSVRVRGTGSSGAVWGWNPAWLVLGPP